MRVTAAAHDAPTLAASTLLIVDVPYADISVETMRATAGARSAAASARGRISFYAEIRNSLKKGHPVSRRLMLHKAGTQFIKTELPEGRGAHAAAAPSFNSWQEMENDLRAMGAFPEAIQRAKAKFDSGETTVVIDVP